MLTKELLFTTETTKRIINCPTFRNLKKISLDVTSELFDFEMFAEAMKVCTKSLKLSEFQLKSLHFQMLPETDFELSFDFSLSPEYRNQIQAFIDETIDK